MKMNDNNIVGLITGLENAYQNSSLVYETILSHFISIENFPFHTIPLKKGNYIGRARYQKGIEPFDKLSKVSYPPSTIVTQFSRLNRPLQNLFYGSEKKESCLAEMMPLWYEELSIDDIITVTIGFWELEADINVFIIPDTENSNTLNQKIINSLSSYELTFWNYISKKFKISTKDKSSIYEFTTALGNALLLITDANNLEIDGFLYGSVQSPANLNVALKPQIIDSQVLMPRQFQELRIKKIGLNENRLPLYIEVAERKNGKPDLMNNCIIWE
jgi:hypothetical protein